MPVSMYTVSIPIFIQHLNGLNAVLDKAATWAAARKVNEADLLNMRLSPDMFNLTRQVQAATDHAANAAGRLSGKELLKFTNDETTIAQLKDRIAKTIDYLKSVKQSEIDGTEDKDISITFPSFQTRQFTGQSLLLGNSLPNFWFHTTTAYDIVRQCGIEVGSATSWARHRRRKPSCELTGASIADHKQTFRRVRSMSALPTLTNWSLKFTTECR